MACFPARLETVPVAMAFVAQALRDDGATPMVVARAELILEELFRNCVLHGYGGDGARPVWVGAGPAFLCFEDAAPPFNPLCDGPPPPDPSAPLEQRRVGGVGLLLIRQLGAAVTYHYGDGRNRIEISLQA